jgi:GNAT superfamily N-acetyltransferase
MAVTRLVGGITVRSITRSDRPEWEVLWEGYNAFYGRAGLTSLPAHITQLTWNRFSDRDEPMYALVAEIDGQLVGLAHYLFHRNTITEEPVCYMQDLFTLPEVRGRGAGRALIEAVYDSAQTAGAPQV